MMIAFCKSISREAFVFAWIAIRDFKLIAPDQTAELAATAEGILATVRAQTLVFVLTVLLGICFMRWQLYHYA